MDSGENQKGFDFDLYSCGAFERRCCCLAQRRSTKRSVGSRGIQAIKLLYGYAEMRSKHRPSTFRASPSSGIPTRFSHRECQSSFHCCVLPNLELVDIVGGPSSHSNARIVSKPHKWSCQKLPKVPHHVFARLVKAERALSASGFFGLRDNDEKLELTVRKCAGHVHVGLRGSDCAID